MFNKPFKPPSLSRPAAGSASGTSTLPPTQPTLKRPRISSTLSVPQKKTSSTLSSQSYGEVPQTQKSTLESSSDQSFSVLWRKFTLKKNKTWDGDGVLVIQHGYAHIYDEDGREMGKCLCPKGIGPGSTMAVSGKDIEVGDVLLKGASFSNPVVLSNSPQIKLDPKPRQSLNLAHTPIPKPQLISTTQYPNRILSAVPKDNTAANQLEYLPNPATKAKVHSKYRNPVVAGSIINPADIKAKAKPIPRHDPYQAGALVMKRPLSSSIPKGKDVVDVVIDPLLTRHLREHQREGVKFMYECVMGMKEFDGEGCVLADEMGLGKTLQTITLIWTLMKQNPIYNSGPVVRKAIVVCPVSLVNNWRKEFCKWLGNERIGVFIPDENSRSRITDFTRGKVYNVMIVGYEKIRILADELAKAPEIDIVIADEGHRLKTAQNKSAQAIKSLSTSRRIILSGTPIQNDLNEFYVMVDFVNPGLLGKYSTFKREFETPIIKSRQPNATKKDTEKGQTRAAELTDLTGQFILRRTADLLSKYLPPKTEYVFFCAPTPPQATLYRSIISSPLFASALGSPELALQLINLLRKACSSPSLLITPKTKPGFGGRDQHGDPDKPDTHPDKILETWVLPQVNGPTQRQLLQPMACSKVRILHSLLNSLHKTTTEKVVLVSNWTSTLDILASHLSSQSFPYMRLDGGTAAAKRQGIVDQFNRASRDECFVFLLSAKAGGVGLNLIGASRLVLFDIDWNPSIDLQTMARIHRDGQKRHCHIYRFLTMGALDEKVYQRQMTKQGLADSLVDKKHSAPSFTREQLRDLFSLDESGICKTHELIGCECGGNGNLDKALAATASSSPGEYNLEGKDGQSQGSSDLEGSCEDEDLPDLYSLISAAQVNMEEQEQKILDSKRKIVTEKMKTHALMKYIHFDNSKPGLGKQKKPFNLDSDTEDLEDDDPDEPICSADQMFEDPVTIQVLAEPDSLVRYVFSRTM